MALSPRLLFVYIVVYLIFNPEIVSSELLGHPPKLDFLSPWLPEKDSPKLDTEGFPLLQFDDTVINKLDESHSTQHMKILVQSIGTRYTGIVLRISTSKVEVLKKSLTNIFLKMVSTENEMRLHHDLNLIKVYIPISVKSINDSDSQQEIQFLDADLIKYLIQEGKISGFIFESSLILIPTPLCMSRNINFHDSLHLTIKRFKRNMIAVEHRFGYKLELGLAVYSLQECGSLLIGNFSQTILLFDMVVYSHEETDTCESNNGVKECIKLFRDKFLGVKCHAVEQVIAIKM